METGGLKKFRGDFIMKLPGAEIPEKEYWPAHGCACVHLKDLKIRI